MTMHSDKREYRLLTIDSTMEMLAREHVTMPSLIVREGFAINLDLARANVPQSLASIIGIPFNVKDYRILRLVAGEAQVEVNLTTYTLMAGDVLFIKENSYFEVKSVSDDARGEVLVFAPQLFAIGMALHGRSFIKIHPTPRAWDEIGHLFYTIYIIAREEPYRSEVVEPLVAALTNLINGIAHTDAQHTAAQPRAEHIFNRFVELITTNKAGKQPVAYYADHLCITPQYLSKVVTAVSGTTVSQWINKAVVLDARILLRDTTKSISEIADELHFPNDSFFCRFFKRETGQTPMQYRRGVAR